MYNKAKFFNELGWDEQFLNSASKDPTIRDRPRQGDTRDTRNAYFGVVGPQLSKPGDDQRTGQGVDEGKKGECDEAFG